MKVSTVPVPSFNFTASISHLHTHTKSIDFTHYLQDEDNVADIEDVLVVNYDSATDRLTICDDSTGIHATDPIIAASKTEPTILAEMYATNNLFWTI